MAHSETLTLYQQAERLREWRAGFQAAYVTATGMQTGFFDQKSKSGRWPRWGARYDYPMVLSTVSARELA
jgi:hypothetical protein